jgi:[ribosomal protein S5]-alanine N-acetyltransferase
MPNIQACASSPRLRLTPLCRDDAAPLQTLGDGLEVFAHIPEIAQPFVATDWVSSVLNNKGVAVGHVVRLSSTHEVVGYVQINTRRNASLQFGYWFGRSVWGQGLGTEAAAAALLLFYAAGGRGLIFAAASPANVASVRILNKLGFAAIHAPMPLSEVADGMVDHVTCLL